MVGLETQPNEIGGICPVNRLYNEGNKAINIYIKVWFGK
jgi:hypothetical protein